MIRPSTVIVTLGAPDTIINRTIQAAVSRPHWGTNIPVIRTPTNMTVNVNAAVPVVQPCLPSTLRSHFI